MHDAPPPYATVVFDCDSTLAAMEGIEELAQGAGAEEIRALTRAAMDGAINTSKRRAYDAFRDTIAAWERDVRAYRCVLPRARAAELARGIKGWDCRDVHFAVDMISHM